MTHKLSERAPLGRRRWLALAAQGLGWGAGLALGLGAAPVAQAEGEGAVIGAPKILEALNPKDIVLDGTPRPSRHGPRGDPRIALQVPFTFGSAELMPQGKRQLDELAMALSDQALANVAFELAGHTDAVGDATANLRLSMDRANAVKAYLVEAHRLSPARLQAIGFGASRLADAAHPTAAVNRRVEVRRLRAGASAPPARPPATPAPLAPAPGGRLVPTPN